MPNDLKRSKDCSRKRQNRSINTIERGEGWTKKVLELEIGMMPECYALLTDVSLVGECFLGVNPAKKKRLQLDERCLRSQLHHRYLPSLYLSYQL